MQDVSLGKLSLIGYDKINQSNEESHFCRLLRMKRELSMNKLYRMTTEEFEKRKILYARDDTKYIVMDGDGVNTYEEYFDRLWNCFDFDEIPDGWKKNFYTIDDFLTDDYELTADKYVFIIENYEKFLSQDFKKKFLQRNILKKIFYLFGTARLKPVS